MKLKSIAEQYQGWCVHYRGPFHNKTCKAGVNYEDLAKVSELGREGCWLRLPCLRSSHEESKGQPVFPCDKLRWPTKEEALAVEDRVHQRSEELLKEHRERMEKNGN